MSVLNLLQKDIVDKLAVADEMYVMLGKLEWCLEDSDGNLRCPVCKGLGGFGHKEGCALDSLLIKAYKNDY